MSVLSETTDPNLYSAATADALELMNADPSITVPAAVAFLDALSGSRLDLYNQTNTVPVNGDLRQESTAGAIKFYKRVSGAWVLTGGFNGDTLLIDATANSISIGDDNMPTSTAGNDNIAIGTGCLKSVTGVTTSNIAIGINIMGALASSGGNYNVGIGKDILVRNSSFIFENVGIGVGALQYITGADNVGVGYNALQGVTGVSEGYNNVAIGFASIEAVTIGQSNTCVGTSSGRSLTSGNFNVGIGDSSLFLLTTGTNNSAVGNSSLYSLVSGSAFNGTNCSGLGYNTKVSGDNQVQLGDSATTTYAFGAVQNRSDIRDKTDIRDTVLGLSFINKLRAVDFKWDYRDDYIVTEGKEVIHLPKDGSKKRSRYHHGLIAQEVKEVIDATGIDFAGYQDHSINGGCDVLSIGYTELIGPLIKAVQELSKEVEQLKRKNK